MADREPPARALLLLLLLLVKLVMLLALLLTEAPYLGVGDGVLSGVLSGDGVPPRAGSGEAGIEELKVGVGVGVGVLLGLGVLR